MVGDSVSQLSAVVHALRLVACPTASDSRKDLAKQELLRRVELLLLLRQQQQCQEWRLQQQLQPVQFPPQQEHQNLDWECQWEEEATTEAEVLLQLEEALIQLCCQQPPAALQQQLLRLLLLRVSLSGDPGVWLRVAARLLLAASEGLSLPPPILAFLWTAAAAPGAASAEKAEAISPFPPLLLCAELMNAGPHVLSPLLPALAACGAKLVQSPATPEATTVAAVAKALRTAVAAIGPLWNSLFDAVLAAAVPEPLAAAREAAALESAQENVPHAAAALAVLLAAKSVTGAKQHRGHHKSKHSQQQHRAATQFQEACEATAETRSFEKKANDMAAPPADSWFTDANRAGGFGADPVRRSLLSEVATPQDAFLFLRRHWLLQHATIADPKKSYAGCAVPEFFPVFLPATTHLQHGQEFPLKMRQRGVLRQIFASAVVCLCRLLMGCQPPFTLVFSAFRCLLTLLTQVAAAESRCSSCSSGDKRGRAGNSLQPPRLRSCKCCCNCGSDRCLTPCVSLETLHSRALASHAAQQLVALLQPQHLLHMMQHLSRPIAAAAGGGATEERLAARGNAMQQLSRADGSATSTSSCSPADNGDTHTLVLLAALDILESLIMAAGDSITPAVSSVLQNALVSVLTAASTPSQPLHPQAQCVMWPAVQRQAAACVWRLILQHAASAAAGSKAARTPAEVSATTPPEETSEERGLEEITDLCCRLARGETSVERACLFVLVEAVLQQPAANAMGDVSAEKPRLLSPAVSLFLRASRQALSLTDPSSSINRLFCAVDAAETAASTPLEGSGLEAAKDAQGAAAAATVSSFLLELSCAFRASAAFLRQQPVGAETVVADGEDSAFSTIVPLVLEAALALCVCSCSKSSTRGTQISLSPLKAVSREGAAKTQKQALCLRCCCVHAFRNATAHVALEAAALESLSFVPDINIHCTEEQQRLMLQLALSATTVSNEEASQFPIAAVACCISPNAGAAAAALPQAGGVSTASPLESGWRSCYPPFVLRVLQGARLLRHLTHTFCGVDDSPPAIAALEQTAWAACCSWSRQLPRNAALADAAAHRRGRASKRGVAAAGIASQGICKGLKASSKQQQLLQRFVLPRLKRKSSAAAAASSSAATDDPADDAAVHQICQQSCIAAVLSDIFNSRVAFLSTHNTHQPRREPLPLPVVDSLWCCCEKALAAASPFERLLFADAAGALFSLLKHAAPVQRREHQQDQLQQENEEEETTRLHAIQRHVRAFFLSVSPARLPRDAEGASRSSDATLLNPAQLCSLSLVATSLLPLVQPCVCLDRAAKETGFDSTSSCRGDILQFALTATSAIESAEDYLATFAPPHPTAAASVPFGCALLCVIRFLGASLPVVAALESAPGSKSLLTPATVLIADAARRLLLSLMEQANAAAAAAAKEPAALTAAIEGPIAHAAVEAAYLVSLVSALPAMRCVAALLRIHESSLTASSRSSDILAAASLSLRAVIPAVVAAVEAAIACPSLAVRREAVRCATAPVPGDPQVALFLFEALNSERDSLQQQQLKMLLLQHVKLWGVPNVLQWVSLLTCICCNGVAASPALRGCLSTLTPNGSSHSSSIPPRLLPRAQQLLPQTKDALLSPLAVPRLVPPLMGFFWRPLPSISAAPPSTSTAAAADGDVLEEGETWLPEDGGADPEVRSVVCATAAECLEALLTLPGVQPPRCNRHASAAVRETAVQHADEIDASLPFTESSTPGFCPPSPDGFASCAGVQTPESCIADCLPALVRTGCELMLRGKGRKQLQLAAAAARAVGKEMQSRRTAALQRLRAAATGGEAEDRREACYSPRHQQDRMIAMGVEVLWRLAAMGCCLSPWRLVGLLLLPLGDEAQSAAAVVTAATAKRPPEWLLERRLALACRLLCSVVATPTACPTSVQAARPMPVFAEQRDQWLSAFDSRAVALTLRLMGTLLQKSSHHAEQQKQQESEDAFSRVDLLRCLAVLCEPLLPENTAPPPVASALAALAVSEMNSLAACVTKGDHVSLATPLTPAASTNLAPVTAIRSNASLLDCITEALLLPLESAAASAVSTANTSAERKDDAAAPNSRQAPTEELCLALEVSSRLLGVQFPVSRQQSGEEPKDAHQNLLTGSGDPGDAEEDWEGDWLAADSGVDFVAASVPAGDVFASSCLEPAATETLCLLSLNPSTLRRGCASAQKLAVAAAAAFRVARQADGRNGGVAVPLWQQEKFGAGVEKPKDTASAAATAGKVLSSCLCFMWRLAAALQSHPEALAGDDAAAAFFGAAREVSRAALSVCGDVAGEAWRAVALGGKAAQRDMNPPPPSGMCEAALALLQRCFCVVPRFPVACAAASAVSMLLTDLETALFPACLCEGPVSGLSPVDAVKLLRSLYDSAAQAAAATAAVTIGEHCCPQDDSAPFLNHCASTLEIAVSCFVGDLAAPAGSEPTVEAKGRRLAVASVRAREARGVLALAAALVALDFVSTATRDSERAASTPACNQKRAEAALEPRATLSVKEPTEGKGLHAKPTEKPTDAPLAAGRNAAAGDAAASCIEGPAPELTLATEQATRDVAAATARNGTDTQEKSMLLWPADRQYAAAQLRGVLLRFASLFVHERTSTAASNPQAFPNLLVAASISCLASSLSPWAFRTLREQSVPQDRQQHPLETLEAFLLRLPPMKTDTDSVLHLSPLAASLVVPLSYVIANVASYDCTGKTAYDVVAANLLYVAVSRHPAVCARAIEAAAALPFEEQPLWVDSLSNEPAQDGDAAHAAAATRTQHVKSAVACLLQQQAKRQEGTEH
ncbi:hypothetical protein cyc_04811 [Cyclospora cayetanensis]|uniref:Uncharacterized protein n=1 Tax=Cyclospora cayetanensis TaxID=88456 RepID=A0A1D3CW48_9EIME|nr:hypothetical protein cyc_04811 [Cyclospora cayetanensis]